jgi:hypothetical protein
MHPVVQGWCHEYEFILVALASISYAVPASSDFTDEFADAGSTGFAASTPPARQPNVKLYSEWVAPF